MDVKENKQLFGLVGKNISYSFSRSYFSDKFDLLNLEGYKYINFDIENINNLEDVITTNATILKGLNVTIPYKEEVLQFLDKVDQKAEEIGAVNTIKITKKGKLKGYNTDYYGFKKSIEPLLKKYHKKALILGTGGASKAVAFALKKMDIEVAYVSRKGKGIDTISYEEMTKEIIEDNLLIINSTPLGTHPNVNVCPQIPYEFIGKKHILYDLIYNPSKTLFLKKGEACGAVIKNGLEMLELQAEKAWEIWQK